MCLHARIRAWLFQRVVNRRIFINTVTSLPPVGVWGLPLLGLEAESEDGHWLMRAGALAVSLALFGQM